MASTPPPPSTIHTPATPLHGARFDSPAHISLRKSSRLSKQRADRTPSPGITASFSSEGPGELKHTPRSKRSRSNPSPPSSPIQPDDMVATTRSTSIKKAQAQAQGAKLHVANHHLASLGLPTPIKTPRKKPLQVSAASAARVLFPHQQDGAHLHEQLPVTPSKRSKRMKRQVGFSLDDDDFAKGNGGIEIYTDSKDKVPELDEAEDNPFLVKKDRAARGARQMSNKRKREIESEDELLKEGVKQMQRDEGMIYVFRGKRFFKKFSSDGPPSPLHDDIDRQRCEEEVDAMDLAQSPSHGHFTRASLKPRRLFASTTDDEEAPTDIEDPEKHGLPTAKSPSKEMRVKTHVKENKRSTSAARSIHSPASPFDSWPRRKNASLSSSTTGAKGEEESHQPKRMRQSS